MSGITAIQALSPAEAWDAWQALLQASLAEAGAEGAVPGEMKVEPGAELHVEPHHGADLAAPPVSHAEAHPQALPTVPVAMDAQAPVQARPDAPVPPAMPAREARSAGTQSLLLQPPSHGLPADMPVAATRLADAGATVLPMAPVLMTPLALQNGPELRWRVQDAATWRALFDDADGQAQDDEDEEPLPAPAAPEAVEVEAMPAWAQALLACLRDATAAPVSAAPLRAALQAWRVGLPVLLASPAGLASLQASRDAAVWRWRRWPARWRSARPATTERWWAVRVGLGAQGRPRTLRDLAGTTPLPPGQVSCELRLDGVAPAGSSSLAQWTEVLVHAAASPSLRALLAAHPSLTWLLCNQPLWPQENP